MTEILKFDTSQCQCVVYKFNFKFNGEELYCIVSKHNATGYVNTRYGNKLQIESIINTYPSMKYNSNYKGLQ